MFSDTNAGKENRRRRRGLWRIRTVTVRLPLGVHQLDATSRGTITVAGSAEWVFLDGRKGIKIEELTLGAHTSRSGPIDVGRAAGKVHLHTNGGKVSVRADGPTELVISTRGGDVGVSGRWDADVLDIREGCGMVTLHQG